MRQPILRNAELEKLRQVSHDVFKRDTIDITWPVAEGAGDGARGRAHLRARARLHRRGRQRDHPVRPQPRAAERAAIPSLLAVVAAVHHHLVREGTRLRAGLVIESGEPREVHHMCTLIGYGASRDQPVPDARVARDLIADGASGGADRRGGRAPGRQGDRQGPAQGDLQDGHLDDPVLLRRADLRGRGPRPELVERHFTGTASRIGGVGLDVLAREALEPPRARVPASPRRDLLPVGGLYQWRRDGERRMWDPETIALLQHSVRANGDGNGNAQQTYDRFAKLVNEENARHGMLRGLLKLRDDVDPIPLDEVEPATEIVKRFSTGGMSLGALSPEAHETLAIAMNRIGGMSNTGEGGEDERRYRPDANGDLRRSAIKQVASGRFGVTIDYLVNADQLQIKIAQGAKPGEGGQLPGHKVDDYIARLRHSTPGVGLISPPPHHDIYSIEDLKQLIYDLRCANPTARVSVKLVAEVGVGTVAAGVAKANADHVVIAGHDGGTGASPQSSIQSAGVPWEIGLAETQQTLLAQRPALAHHRPGRRPDAHGPRRGRRRAARRRRVRLLDRPADRDGLHHDARLPPQHLPGRGRLAGPGAAQRFAGTPEHVVNYLFMVAEETRRIMASLGVRTIDELIGRSRPARADDAIDHWKARGVDLSGCCACPTCRPARRGTAPSRRRRCSTTRWTGS